MTNLAGRQPETRVDALLQIADKLQVLVNQEKNLWEINGIVLEKFAQGTVDDVTIEAHLALQQLLNEQAWKVRKVVLDELLEYVEAENEDVAN